MILLRSLSNVRGGKDEKENKTRRENFPRFCEKIFSWNNLYVLGIFFKGIKLKGLRTLCNHSSPNLDVDQKVWSWGREMFGSIFLHGSMLIVCWCFSCWVLLSRDRFREFWPDSIIIMVRAFSNFSALWFLQNKFFIMVSLCCWISISMVLCVVNLNVSLFG